MKDPASNPELSPNDNASATNSRELMKRHMEDPEHVISDEELRQVTISTDDIELSEHPLIKALDDKS